MIKCKGRCLYDPRVIAHTHYSAKYDKGEKTCRACEIRLLTTDSRCFCCGQSLRIRAKNPKPHLKINLPTID